MKVDLFGPPRLLEGGQERQHSSRKAMALLAYLAMRAGAPVTRQHLADLLWAEAGSDQARINLRQCLSQLRDVLGSHAAALVSANEQLTLSPFAFDIPARDLLAGIAPDAAAAIAAGPGFLEGFSVRSAEFEAWATAQRHLLEHRLADHLEQSGRKRLAEGDAANAARDLALVVKLDPFREPAHRDLMQAQSDLGKTSSALAQFEKCRAILKEHLGVEPDAATRALAARIRASRLQRDPESVPAFSRFGSDREVAIYRESDRRTGTLHEMARGTATDAIQAALDRLRAEQTQHAARVAVVTGGPSQDDELREARALLAQHPGPGLLVAAAVYQAFEHWSPFSFRPETATRPFYLLEGEIPRHRLQIAPTTSRPQHRPLVGCSIIVLPFRDHSPDASHLNLGDVIAEEIIARLARFRQVMVAGPTAGQSCRALGLSVGEVRERLGVDYAVDGSIARIGDRLVITFSITDLAADRVVHADRFEGAFADLFAQQSVMADRIASTLFNRTEQAQMDRLAARLTDDMGAYERYLFGLSAHRRGGISVHNAHDAVRHFESAIAIDPRFVRARAFRLCALSWFAPKIVDETGFAEIDRLIAIDDNDPEVHRIAGALNHIAGDTDVAVAHIERAVDLNPSDAYLLSNAAAYRAYAGDADGALALIRRAMVVDPFLPAWCVEDHGVVLFANGSWTEAVGVLRRLSVPTPRALAYLAAALVEQGDTPAASRAIERLRRIAPDFTIENLMRFASFKDSAILARLRGNLGRAGLP